MPRWRHSASSFLLFTRKLHCLPVKPRTHRRMIAIGPTRSRRTSGQLRARCRLSATGASRPPKRTWRFSPATDSGPNAGASRFCSRTARRSTSTRDSRVNMLSESLVRLVDGRLRLTLARNSDAFDYRVDTVAGSVVLRTAGDYRISFGARRGAPELQVAVLRGQADVVNSYGRTALRAGTEGLAVDGRAPSAPYAINSALGDSFDRWIDTIRAERLGQVSSPYLPADLRVYGGAFDHYGSWDYLPSYGGHVWYPRVSVGWRPYSVGRWSFYGNFGWFWVGADRWSWPTHHYGRWGQHANRWYGCPIVAGRRPGWPGVARRATPVGVRSASMAGRSSDSRRCVMPIRGRRGPWSQRASS